MSAHTAWHSGLLRSGLGLLTVLVAGCAASGGPGTGSGMLAAPDSTGGLESAGFSVLRYSSAGQPDAALNSTLQLGCEQRDGLTVLCIDVSDVVFTTTVALDVRYNAACLHPQRVEFAGLLGGEQEALSASFLTRPGIAALGSTAIGSHVPATLNGRFATLYFAPGAASGHSVSAAGVVHHNPDGVGFEVQLDAGPYPNFEGMFDPEAHRVVLNWYGAWVRGDGTQDGSVNIYDLTPIGQYWHDNPNDNWDALRADYDGNAEVNVADLTAMGLYIFEGCTGYSVEASDNTEGASRLALGSVDWADGDHFDSANAVDGELYPTFNRWNFEVNDTTTPVNLAALQVLDENLDYQVRFYVTPQFDPGSGAMNGVESFINLPVNVAPTLTTVVITGYTVQLTGATGGSGVAGDIFGLDEQQVSIVANSSVNLALKAISGTCNADPFDETTLPLPMDQADYDAALAAARTALQWSIAAGTTAGFRQTMDCLDPETGVFPFTGDPGACTVFPDDDPESDAASPEGWLTTSLPDDTVFTYPSDGELEVHVLAPVNYQLGLDVTADPQAPTLLGYYAMNLDPLSDVPTDTSTELLVNFAWGSIVPPVFSSCKLQVLAVVDGTASSPYLFSYSSAVTMMPGQYAIRELSPPQSLLVADCVVSQTQLPLVGEAAFRLNAGGVWSSINQPLAMLHPVTP
jgi:hypothetical protein